MHKTLAGHPAHWTQCVCVCVCKSFQYVFYLMLATIRTQKNIICVSLQVLFVFWCIICTNNIKSFADDAFAIDVAIAILFACQCYAQAHA